MSRIESLFEEALPAVTASTQLFANCPDEANAAIIDLRSSTSACKGITLRRDGSAATADANGVNIPLGQNIIPLDQTNALLMRAIQNGGTVTGWVQYIKATADIIAALAQATAPKDRAAEITAAVSALRPEVDASTVLTADGTAFAYPVRVHGVHVMNGSSLIITGVRDGGAAGTILYGPTTATTGQAFYDLKGVRFETDCYVDFGTGTGSVVVLGEAI